MTRVAARNVGTVCAFVVTLIGFAGAPGAAKKEKPKAPAASTPAEPVNACGCYKDGKGACVCTDKKAKCDCPGECEPVGCAAKREQEMEREMAAEVKRAQEDEKRRKAAEEAAERGETVPDGGVGAAPAEEGTPPPAKKPGKARPKPPAKT
jgi:hypothetical protein